MPVRVGKSRRAKKSKSRKVKESKSFVNYDLWSQCLLTRKHCPKQKGRYPGFHAPSDTFSDLVSVQWYTAGGVSLVIYSCATAHDLHVIPSWPPFCEEEPNCSYLSKCCRIDGYAVSTFPQCHRKDTTTLWIGKFFYGGK